jgi:hypothetical protein
MPQVFPFIFLLYDYVTSVSFPVCGSLVSASQALMRSLSLLGLILASFCQGAAALHESDVGIIDWHQPHAGVPQTSSLSTAPTFHAKPGRPPTEVLLLTATSSNVLAALHASNGSLGAYLYHDHP